MTRWIHYEWGRYPDGKTGWRLDIGWCAMLVLAFCAFVVMVHC